jgi:hypothetical protein
MVCRSKCLGWRVGFDDCFTVAFRLRVDDAVKPVLDSVEKLAMLDLEEIAHDNIFLPNHTSNGTLHSQAGFEEHVSTQARTGHSRAALGFAAHALRAV